MKENKNFIVKESLSNPVVFNAFFEEAKFCASFLNSTGLFNIEEDSIIIEKTIIEEGINFKTSNMDVKIKIDDYMYINMEMQNQNPKYDMMSRLNFYLGRTISRSQPKGKGYKNSYSIVIAIFNFTMFKGDNEYIREFLLRDKNGNEIEYTKIIVVELTKKQYCDKKELREWLELFNEKNLNYLKEASGIMNDAAKKIVELNSDDEIMLILDAYERYNRDRAAELEAAIEEGLEKGRTVGMAEGRAQGIAQGIAQGETKATLEVAKNMKSYGMSIEVIIEITKLDRKIVEEL